MEKGCKGEQGEMGGGSIRIQKQKEVGRRGGHWGERKGNA